MSNPAQIITEHQIFWMLVKKGQRRNDVGRVYLAVQAALAYQRETLDVSWLLGAMMAEGQSTTNADTHGIGASGLAYFHWLFEVVLRSAGEDDLHVYSFRRRHDNARLAVSLRTAPGPRSLQFQQQYERERRRLETKRAHLLAEGRW